MAADDMVTVKCIHGISISVCELSEPWLFSELDDSFHIDRIENLSVVTVRD